MGDVREKGRFAAVRVTKEQYADCGWLIHRLILPDAEYAVQYYYVQIVDSSTEDSMEALAFNRA